MKEDSRRCCGNSTCLGLVRHLNIGVGEFIETGGLLELGMVLRGEVMEVEVEGDYEGKEKDKERETCHQEDLKLFIRLNWSICLEKRNVWVGNPIGVMYKLLSCAV